MERLPKNIPKYSGGCYDPLSRFLIVIAALVMAWLFNRGSGSTWVGILCFVPLVAAGVCIAFLYTEVDGERIATVLRIGNFSRVQISRVPWSEVAHAEVRKGGSPNSAFTADLMLTTKDGKRHRFTTSRFGKGEETFRAIAHHFHDKVA